MTTRRALAAAFWFLAAIGPASAQSPSAQAGAALRQSPAQFWDGNTRRGDVAEPAPVAAVRSESREAIFTAPPIRRVVEVPEPRLASTPSGDACRRALVGHPKAARLCESHPTLAPLLAGLLDAFRQQFATVEGITQNLLWILISILMTAISGFGAVAKLAMSLASLAVGAWMLWPIFRQGYDSVRRLRKAADGSRERFEALFNLGVAGGTLLILALVTAAGWAIGKSRAGGKLVGSLDGALEAGASKLGLHRAPPAQSPASTIAGFFNNVADPHGLRPRGRRSD